MDDFKKALNYSFLLLKYRLRSKLEIIERLGKRNFPSSTITDVLNYLENNNYINDEEFSRLFVESYLSKGCGKRKIDFKLNRLGISKDIRDTALNDISVFKEKIRGIIKKKMVYYQNKKNVYQKIVRHLLSKGFEYSEIIEEMNKFFSME